MIRNLKVLVAAAMALGAFGAVSASGAQAAQFHCSAEICVGKLKPDEAAGTKTAHHVLVVENLAKTESVSFTCNSLSGSSTQSKKTVSEVEFKSLLYNECTVNGSPGVTIDMNGCSYNFDAAGALTITGCVNAGKTITITIGSFCVFSIPEQTLMGNAAYHNLGTTPNREVTIEIGGKVPEAKVTASGTTANCKINPSQTLVFTYLTGNTIVTGETTGGVMADAWWE